jgi:hypothetical protein
MDTNARCQSCGMPLGSAGFYGTNADGSDAMEYCRFCFQQGAFVEPELTVDEMVDRSIEYMTNSMKFDKAEAEALSKGVIPGLKRWQK